MPKELSKETGIDHASSHANVGWRPSVAERRRTEALFQSVGESSPNALVAVHVAVDNRVWGNTQ